MKEGVRAFGNDIFGFSCNLRTLHTFSISVALGNYINKKNFSQIYFPPIPMGDFTFNNREFFNKKMFFYIIR